MSEPPQEEVASSTFPSQSVDTDGGRPIYTIPGVLHFLQHEWTRFERERSNWEVERAELRAKIAFLQGERKGQENLKRDLLRRIKMLEYALKQERTKVQRLKNGLEDNPAESVTARRPRDSVREVSSATSSAVSEAQQASLRQGRHLLRQYLQEIGYADAVIGVRTSRLSSLLSLAGSDSASGSMSTSTMSQRRSTTGPLPMRSSDAIDREPGSVTTDNGLPSSSSSRDEVDNGKKLHTSSLKVTLKPRLSGQSQNEDKALSPVKPLSPKQLTGFPDSAGEDTLSEEETVVASFNFLQGLADDEEKDSDEDDDDGVKDTLGNVDLLDPDQEAAIAEFGFLTHESEEEDRRDIPFRSVDSSEEDLAQELLADSGSSSSTHLGGNEWRVGIDPAQLSKLKNEYRQDRKNKSKLHRPTHSQLQMMMSNLQGDEVPTSSNMQGIFPMSDTGHMDERDGGNELPGFAARMPGPGRKSRKPLTLHGGGASTDGESVDLDLGVLVNLPEYLHSAPELDASNSKVWSPRYSLRSHFDCVRSLAFHPTEELLVTASEDWTLKLWNLQKPQQAKKSSIFDLEPLYTFRGHRGAVWCCSTSACGTYTFSGSSDMTICRWLLPSESCDTYGSYGSCQELTDGFRRSLKGHTDAVWGLVELPQPSGVLVSCGADSTCRLWRHRAEEPLVATIHVSTGQPTSVDCVPCEPGQFVAGFTDGKGVIYDVETRQPVVTFNGCSDQTGLQRVNRVACHPMEPVTVMAHEDHHLRFYDNRTGNRLHSMVAHLDGVTSLAVDPNGLFVVSGSHDCSLRLWNFETKACVQEMTSHRKKHEESICDVAFHPSKPMIGSAGADAIAKVFM